MKRPVHQSVYENLRDQLLFGDLTPGQAVTIQGLVEELGAGMTPVREASRRLVANGALHMMDNRRITVPTMTIEDVEQLEFMRKTIEPSLAGRAVAFVDDDMLYELNARDDALNTAISKGDIKGYLSHNYHFHAYLNEAARAPILKATVDRMWLRFGPSLRVVCGRYGTFNLPDKHADLLDALSTKNKAAAENAMLEDVAQGMAQIRETLVETQIANRFD